MTSLKTHTFLYVPLNYIKSELAFCDIFYREGTISVDIYIWISVHVSIYTINNTTGVSCVYLSQDRFL